MSEAPSRAPPPPPPRSATQQLSENSEFAEEAVENYGNSEENFQQEEEIFPTEVYNGDFLEKQQVGPGKYLHYTLTVEGGEDDVVDLKVSRLVHSATANIYVNLPNKEEFPTAEKFSWNPTKGPLYGPVGTYRIAVHGVPSFIEKDDMWLVDPNSNWSTFDLSVSWELLDEATRSKMKAISDQYKRDKASSTWAQGYQEEMLDKYTKEVKESENELIERLRLLELQNSQEISVDGTEFAKNYELGAFLGSSNGFSVVKKAKEKSTGKEFAVKLIDKARAGGDGIHVEDLKKQIKILNSVASENVVQLVKDFDSSNVFALVMELLDGVSVDKFVASHPKYTEENARNVVRQVLNGLKHLHSKNVVHKSVLPGNVVVSKDGLTAKLVGFTLADNSSGDDQTLSGGNPAYQAPEVINRQSFGVAVDIWSLGCLTFFLLSGNSAFSDTNSVRLNSKIKQGKYDFSAPEFSAVSEEAKNFVKSLLVVDPKARPNAQTALANPWLSKMGGNPLPQAVNNVKTYLEE